MSTLASRLSEGCLGFRGTPKDGLELVPDAISQQAEATPDALAVASKEGSVNYGQLNSRAAVLARALAAHGAKADTVVAVCLKRSPGFVVAALASLKAGAAYLPLSPSDPSHRLAFLLNDAGAQILITNQETRIPAEAGVQHVVYVDDLGRMLSEHGAGEVSSQTDASPSNLAYVIYTSGSTGEPKGVEITHAGLSNLVDWHNSTFQITANDRATQVARLVFDAAVWEIWPYLVAGASIHLPPEQILNDPEGLRDWLAAQRITVSFVPTPMAERLLSLSWPKETQLRLLLTGGDVLHRLPPEGLPFKLINNYGPTECAVVATSCLVKPNGSTARMPSIGGPVTNARLYVLDPSLKPVSNGTPGELYIGGPGVARGYRNRPDLTAERFITNPWSPSERLFRTGDLVQALPDGQLGFIGRLDEQIKVRGFRIEPHEIITALNSHPEIAQSFVVAQETLGGERRLVAYVVCGKGSPIKPGDLRNYLKARLPDYMVPELFVKLETLPLTANGKVDRAALPVPDENNVISDEISTAPESDLEKAVAGVLAPLLGVKTVDVNANFFALGGHSLLGTQLIARLRDTFGVELPLRTIFESPTVAGLSAAIDRLLLARLESMSEAEAEHLLESGQPVFALSS